MNAECLETPLDWDEIAQKQSKRSSSSNRLLCDDTRESFRERDPLNQSAMKSMLVCNDFWLSMRERVDGALSDRITIDSFSLFVSPKPSASSISKELESIFREYAKAWKEATGGSSLTIRRYAHPDYHRILALGKDVVPLILRELDNNPDWWFEALKTLTGADPVNSGSTFNEAVSAWLAWGREQDIDFHE